MKVDKKISLQYPLIKGTILIEETDSTHLVPRMPFFNIVPLKGEALFMVYDISPSQMRRTCVHIPSAA